MFNAKYFNNKNFLYLTDNDDENDKGDGGGAPYLYHMHTIRHSLLKKNTFGSSSSYNTNSYERTEKPSNQETEKLR